MSIFITGDTHANFLRFGIKNFNGYPEDVVIICGDFGGVWDGSKNQEYWLNWLSQKPYTICFADGNHESFDLLKQYKVVNFHGGKAHKIKENIYHLMRGEIFDFEGKKYFVFGGARSHDIDGGVFERDDKIGIAKARKGTKCFRVNHVSWWAEEEASEEEQENAINNLNNVDWQVDYVITHDAPLSVLKTRWWFIEPTKTNLFLNDLVMRKLKFTKWFCGHYHTDETVMGKFEFMYEKFYEIR